MLPTVWTSVLFLALGFPAQRSTESGPLEAEALIPGPLNEVWDAWTTREGVLAWQVANTGEIDLRIGAV